MINGINNKTYSELKSMSVDDKDAADLACDMNIDLISAFVCQDKCHLHTLTVLNINNLVFQ